MHENGLPGFELSVYRASDLVRDAENGDAAAREVVTRCGVENLRDVCVNVPIQSGGTPMASASNDQRKKHTSHRIWIWRAVTPLVVSVGAVISRIVQLPIRSRKKMRGSD
jgi:hypothetical protein